MKSFYLFIQVVAILCFTACTSIDNDPSQETSLYETVKTVYGLEEVTYGISGTEQIPYVSLEEMQAVLEALCTNSNKSNSCLIESTNDASFGGKNEINRKVIMGSEYSAKTRSGNHLENFLLRVELKFNIDNNQIYYYGTDYLYNSGLFDWRANGLSLYPVKNKDQYTYEFESESFLYFKIKDEANRLVKVSILFKGEYNFKTEKGIYSFQLEKHNK